MSVSVNGSIAQWSVPSTSQLREEDRKLQFIPYGLQPDARLVLAVHLLLALALALVLEPRKLLRVLLFELGTRFGSSSLLCSVLAGHPGASVRAWRGRATRSQGRASAQKPPVLAHLHQSLFEVDQDSVAGTAKLHKRTPQDIAMRTLISRITRRGPRASPLRRSCPARDARLPPARGTRQSTQRTPDSGSSTPARGVRSRAGGIREARRPRPRGRSRGGSPRRERRGMSISVSWSQCCNGWGGAG